MTRAQLDQKARFWRGLQHAWGLPLSKVSGQRPATFCNADLVLDPDYAMSWRFGRYGRIVKMLARHTYGLAWRAGWQALLLVWGDVGSPSSLRTDFAEWLDERARYYEGAVGSDETV
jgi:hypothetical protein